MFSILEDQDKAQMKLFFTEQFQNIFLKILKKQYANLNGRSSQHACMFIIFKRLQCICSVLLWKDPGYKSLYGSLGGTKAKAVAVCHTNTMEWNPKYLAFQQLKVKPGTAPICHFLPKDHIVWVVSK